MPRLIVLLILFLNPYSNFSQNNFRFEHFTTEQGLSENYIYTIIQDSKGFLWIGTHDGLNRYDGYRFKKFKHNPADSNSLPNNTINSICEDKDGNIWLGTNAGICKYDPAKNKFTRLTLQNNVLGIQQVLMATANEILVKNFENFILVNINSQKEQPVTVDSNSANKDKFPSQKAPVTKDKNGNMYVANFFSDSVNVWRYDSLNKRFVDFASLPVRKSWYNDILHFFMIDSHGRFHIALNDSYITCNAPSETFHTDPLNFKEKIKHVNQVYEDNEGNIWVASRDGLLFYDTKKRTEFRFTTGNSENTISSQIILSIMQDDTGIIWIATGNGINKLNPQQARFSHLNTDKSNKASLYNNFVFGISAESNNSIRIYYNTEIPFFSRYSLSDNTIRHFSVKNYNYKNWIRDFSFINPERLTDSILNKAIELIRKNQKTTIPIAAQSLFIGNNQTLWQVSSGSLFLLNTLKYWGFNFTITDIRMYKDEIWLSTAGNGLVCLNMTTQKITKYTTGKPMADSISSSDITSLFIEEDGNIWLGTKGGGLNYFDRQKKTFRHFMEDDGLCNNSVYCLVKDNNGKIWLGTSQGLSCFDPATKKFKNYFRADGLINNEYNRHSACKLPDGTIFMGGMNGIDFFHPDSLVLNNSKPSVQLTDFKIFNQSNYPGKTAELTHDQNFISIEFAAMDFNNPAANKFAYMLEGADNDWVILEGRNFTNYSYLQPGHYRFLVKAANSDGVWNDEPASFTFTILPAWYQTWWFIAIVIAMIAAVIYTLFRYRLQQKLRILQVRNRLHRDLHDDVGATLSSVKAYSEILRDNPGNLVISELIKENSTEMLEKLEVIAWATDPQHDHFKSLKNLMTKFATPLCYAKNIQCNIENKAINEDMLMPGEIRQNIFLVFKEAINNMIKYAEASVCSTNMFINNNQFVLQINDNGKGFDGSIKGTGSGWKNMQKRTKVLNGNIEIESIPGKGTTITMSLPYPFRIPSSWERK